jgi:hypothetical protein
MTARIKTRRGDGKPAADQFYPEDYAVESSPDGPYVRCLLCAHIIDTTSNTRTATGLRLSLIIDACKSHVHCLGHA